MGREHLIDVWYKNGKVNRYSISSFVDDEIGEVNTAHLNEFYSIMDNLGSLVKDKPEGKLEIQITEK